VAGHRFPFYLGFHGGQAVGASAGLLLFGLGSSLSRAWISPASLAALAVVALVTFAAYRRGPAVAVTVLPVLLGLVLLGGPDVTFDLFFAVVVCNIWLVNIGIVRDEQIMVAGPRLSGALRRAHQFLHPARH
jgi:glycerol-3-phosphate acyltransferase PlsY